ncbi:class I SAM-dependent methyltransferase [Curtobacterium luteum]|uniref:class I SAM-dependent methyltransferase n=1 Tax=Curtobacterium luteum TaxID=33881 RepID=UPI00380C3F73
MRVGSALRGTSWVLSPFRARRVNENDLLVVKEGTRLVLIPDAFSDDGFWIRPAAEALLGKLRLVPHLFADPELSLYEDALSMEEVSFLHERFSDLKPGRILDVGSGGGRLAIPLAQRGLAVDCLDIEPSLAQPLLDALQAASDSYEPRVFIADAAVFRAYPRYTAAYAGMNSIRYLASRDAFMSHLACMRDSVEDGGNYFINISLGSLDALHTRKAWSNGASNFDWTISGVDRLGEVVEDQITVTDSVTGLNKQEFEVQFAPEVSSLLASIRSAGWSPRFAWTDSYQRVEFDDCGLGTYWFQLQNDSSK